MNGKESLRTIHPQGDNLLTESHAPAQALTVEVSGHRVQVQWDANAHIAPYGQLVFFIQFPGAGGLLKSLMDDCPLSYSGANAPEPEDIIKTILLSVLCGHKRFTNVNSPTFDQVNPGLPGVGRVAGDSSVRRALKRNPPAIRQWLGNHLVSNLKPLPGNPWVLDIDSTVKCVYGRGTETKIGYNPIKHGRPSQIYHSYFIGKLRLSLGVEVHNAKESAPKFCFPGLFSMIDPLPPEQRPRLLRAGCAYGNESFMVECEGRGLKYLSKLRQTKGVGELIKLCGRSATGDWTDVGKGFQAVEQQLQLKGWSVARRVIVLRRLKKAAPKAGADETPPLLPALGEGWGELVSDTFGHQVLITNLEEPPAFIAQAYRDRAGVENAFDELKGQWRWSGYTTDDMERCEIMAMFVALVYNWWSLYVRLVEDPKPGGDGPSHREAVTGRPTLLGGVVAKVRQAGQTLLKITLQHLKAEEIVAKVNRCGLLIKSFFDTARHLPPVERWPKLIQYIFRAWLPSKRANLLPSCQSN